MTVMFMYHLNMYGLTAQVNDTIDEIPDKILEEIMRALYPLL